MDAEIEAAVARDVARNIDGAVAAYEGLITDGKATADVYINLALIYFLCNVPDFRNSYQPSVEIVNRSKSRSAEVLELGRVACGDPAEMRFWLRYFQFIYSYHPLTLEDALVFAQEKEASLVPYFYLLNVTRDIRWRPQANALYESTAALLTLKNRYIRNVLEWEFGDYPLLRISPV